MSAPVDGISHVLVFTRKMSRWVTYVSACLTLSCVRVGRSHEVHTPRMIFANTGANFKSLPAHGAPLRLLHGDQPDVLTAFGQQRLNFYNFQSLKAHGAKKIVWSACSDDNCDYNITVVEQKEKSNPVFVCGSNGRNTLCCNLNPSQQSTVCVPSEEMQSIGESIKDFVTERGGHSVLVETKQSSTDLYLTFSGSQDYVGISKFGRHRVMPVSQNREQHFAGLMLSRRREDPTQDRVYAFYKQKNRDSSLDSKIWTSFVTQVCTADLGGPKNLLQSRWTSKMNARLFCGEGQHRQSFSELVDTATVHADRWQDTTVYALFKNEWGMSAVCVYSIQDISSVFMESSVKGSSPDSTLNRPRTCVNDSTKLAPEILRILDQTSEMEVWVVPVNKAAPVVSNHHNYTHICVDSSQRKSSKCTVLFLSLNNGRIHKVVQCMNYTSIIAEYRPFSHTTHIVNMMLDPPSRKLYVSTRHELVQLDVANCVQYGRTNEDCLLSNDPYCAWDNGSCTSNTRDTQMGGAPSHQSPALVSRPNTHHSKQGPAHQPGHPSDPQEHVVRVSVEPRSKYFLMCPVSSRHAHYAWENHGNATACSAKEDQCVYLIDSMSVEQAGTYRCVSEERGYRKVLAQYHLALGSTALTPQPGSALWLCLLFIGFHDNAL